jgi:hypothetical protein
LEEENVVSTDLITWAAPTFNDCVNAAKALQENDVFGAHRLIATAAEIGLEDLEAELLLKEIGRSTSLGMASLRRAWAKAKARAKRTGSDPNPEHRDDENRHDRQRQADVLIQLAKDAELFHVPDGTGYADLEVKGHRETWPIRSKGFTRWLSPCFFESTAGAPNSEALQSALNVLEARAHFDAAERAIHVRAAGIDGKIYLDLGDRAWRAIEIDANGWRIVDSPPVRFRRASGMHALPVPERGGSLADLRPFLNVRSDRDFILVVAWTLAALRDHGPYPVLALAGEQGTAKSTFSKILRALIDPNTAPLRALPREDRDLFIAASNAHLLVFDNVSGMPNWISDTLCRLSTGGGFSVRALYTNNDEVLFDAARPIILNGVGDIITRPDLADRALFLTLELIPEKKRRSDNELWATFEAARPRILGALLDAIAVGLKRLPATRLPGLPRMADFALWASACEQVFWPDGAFWAAYSDNLDEVVDTVIEADLVGSAVRQLAAELTEWEGTASGLVSALKGVVEESVTRAKDWPSTPEALSNRLRRAATFLRKAGVSVAFRREGKKGSRVITITSIDAASNRYGRSPSEPSAPSADNAFNSLQADSSADSSSNPEETVSRTVSRDRLKSKETDGADGSDGDEPSLPKANPHLDRMEI